MTLALEYLILYREVVYETEFGFSLYDDDPAVQSEGRRRWAELVNEYGAQGWELIIDGLTGTHFKRVKEI